jgi:hypothetical protein
MDIGEKLVIRRSAGGESIRPRWREYSSDISANIVAVSLGPGPSPGFHVDTEYSSWLTYCQSWRLRAPTATAQLGTPLGIIIFTVSLARFFFFLFLVLLRRSH